MRHIFCAFLLILFIVRGKAFSAPSFFNISKEKSFLLNSKLSGEAVQVRLDNFISLSNSNPQQNQDLFIAIESVRDFDFNAMKSKWNLGSRYSELEGLQIWVKEFYSTYTKELPKLRTKLGVQFGRFFYTNLKLDSIWGLGVVESEFRGDPLFPIHQGLTGASFWLKLGKVNFSLFASPISFPDLGTSYSIQDGQVISKSPWFVNAPKTVNFEGEEINLSYDLNLSNRFDILVNPTAIAGVNTEALKADISFYGGFIPSNQFFLEVSPKARVDESGDAFVQANVLPKLVPKTFMAIKFERKLKKMNLWSEFYSEKHNNVYKNDPDLYQSKLYDYTYWSLGLDSKIDFFKTDINFGISYLRNASKDQLELSNSFDFIKYIFGNAIETRMAVNFHPEHINLAFNFKYDLDENAFMASPRFTYKAQNNILVYSQYDLLGRANNSDVNGFLSKQAANDRFTVGLNYVF